ncbi:unnamed protein product [Victoria cruziana]
MVDTIDVILDYLRRHRFTKAEAALRGELVGRQEANGELTHPSTEGLNNTNRDDGAPDRGSYAFESSRPGKVAGQASGCLPSRDSSTELIVKEVECGNVSSFGRMWENNSAAAETSLSLSERRMVNESAGTSEKSFIFQQGSTNLQSFDILSLSAVLYPWTLVMKVDGNLKSSATAMEKKNLYLRLSGHPEHHNVYGLNKINSSWSAFGGNGSEEKHHRVQREHNDDRKTSKVFDTIPLEMTSDGSKHGALYLKDQALEYTWTKDCGTSCPLVQLLDAPMIVAKEGNKMMEQNYYLQTVPMRPKLLL